MVHVCKSQSKSQRKLRRYENGCYVGVGSIYILYKLEATVNLDSILEIPYGYTLTEDQAIEYKQNYSPFRYKKGCVTDIRKYKLPICIIRKSKNDHTDELLVLPSKEYLPFDVSDDELASLNISIGSPKLDDTK
jgi:hypothetical protein